MQPQRQHSSSRSAIPVVMIRQYRGRTAVITGAASGLGRALARALARELAIRKCNVALIDIDSSGLEKVKEELAQLGAVVTGHCVDIGSEQALQRLAAEIGSAHGTVHLVINNAAGSESASLDNTGAAVFERIIPVHFLGG